MTFDSRFDTGSAGREWRRIWSRTAADAKGRERAESVASRVIRG
jgi:hypothetical protein